MKCSYTLESHNPNFYKRANLPKISSQPVLVMINAVYHDKLLIFIGATFREKLVVPIIIIGNIGIGEMSAQPVGADS